MLRFVPRDTRPLSGREAAALHPYTGVTARLLYARGITTAEQADAFLHPSLSQLHDPMRMHGMPEAVAAAVIAELRAQELSAGPWDYLEPHAYEVMKRIENGEIAALHVMEG